MAYPINEQLIVDEKGNPTAVILPIEDYKKILAILEEVEDHKETKILSQSAEFKKLVEKGLEDIKLDRIKPWKEVWNEL
jgi:PHD/YefM family antitoxin component YafN of YafNO toxin-antitoxin module